MSIQLSLSYACKAINFDNCQIFFFFKNIFVVQFHMRQPEKGIQKVLERWTEGRTDGQATKQTII